MARIVKAPEERRSELIATARQLFYTKGYERTSVNDLVKEVGVAQGTFYYYFESKTAVLEAMVDELIAQAQAILQEVVADETLTAIPKWTRAMQVIGNWKLERKEEMLETLRFVISDENVLLQRKLQMKSAQMAARELAKIIAQGVEEGVFATQFVPESAEMVIALHNTFSESLADLLLHPDKYDNPMAIAQRKLSAAQTATERVLGAPSGSLPMIDEKALMVWFAN
jgi:AcrR family transcriptional regulator